MKRCLTYSLAAGAVFALAAAPVSTGWSLAALALLAMGSAMADRALTRNEKAIAIARLELRICELQQRSREITLLFEMSELLHLGNGVVATREIVTSFGPRLFPLYDGAIYLAAPGGGAAELSVWWGESPEVRSLGSHDCWAMRHSQAHGCSHFDGDSSERVCMPMLAFGELIGVLTLRTDPANAAVASMDVVAAFADQVAGAIATARMQETLRTRAMRDSLTGLFNRCYLEETLNRELQRCRTSGTSVSVILIDLDRFKNINDTFGHAGGDALLQQFARLLQRLFRNRHVVGRLGGEEFLVVLPDAAIDEATDLANRLRLEVRALDPRDGDRSLGPVTISAGVATAPDDGIDSRTLLATADRALYLAKNSGRDRVIASATNAIGCDAA